MLCPSCGADAGETSKFCPSCGSTIVRATEAEDVIGRIVAKKYRVEQMIGEGGMGKVYRATQLALDKPVVLKVLRQSLLSDERTVQRFQREAKAASRLNHANSISVLDFGQADDGSMYIAMEFVAGKDLHHILTKEWPLPEARIIRIVGQVLSALSDAHSAGVIHRDLKPENIMVEQRRGDPDFVKVLDFGIAKIQDSTGDEGPALTRAGFVCGTPEYMSPEQARGATIDHRSDLYAIGVILYQLAAGVLPFESDSAVGFATKHLTEDPLPPSRKRPEAKISPAMERLILKALSKDPNLRPQTAEQFRAELIAVGKAARSQGASSGKVRRPENLTAVPRRASTGPTLEEANTQVTEPTWKEPIKPNALVNRPAPAPAPRAAAPTAETLADPGSNATGILFKVITIGLVLGAVGLGGVFVHNELKTADQPYVIPEGAPVPEQQLQANTDSDVKLYEAMIPPEARDMAAAEKHEREGDAAHSRKDLKTAALHYEAAFKSNPDPGIALKLGQIYYETQSAEAARGWWRRHLRDRSESRARTYIKAIYSDL